MADIDAAIIAARTKLGSLDAAGVQTVLRAKIAEVEETHRQRLIPLLEEKVAVEKLSYDHAGGKATLNQLLTLDPDRVWSRIELGRLGVNTGALDEAATAFKAALAAARRVGDERDESVALDQIGDVLKAHGNLPEALKSFRDGLAIADRLAKADPGNAGWQVDLVVSNWKLAANGDDAARRFTFVVATLRKLKDENRLTPAQEKWLPQAETELAKLTPR